MFHDPAALAPLRHFRQQLYTTVLGRRQDSLFELADAVLMADGPRPLVRLSLQAAFRRRWPSTCDALADGSLDADALRQLCVGSLPAPASGQRELWAADGTSYPRADAATSPERTLERRAVAGARQAPIVPAWEYQWLVALPQPATSWVLPLEVRRRGPQVGTPTALLRDQLGAALARRPAGAPRPVVLLDSRYSAGELARAVRAGLAVEVLLRLAKRRTLARAPGPYRGRGARPKHGPAFRTHDQRTHPTPDHTATTTEAVHGTITVAVWDQVHDPVAADAPFAVVCVTLERLAGGRRQPAPLWLAWIGGPLPADLLDLWRWYAARFQIEHGFRFLKQHLGWTTLHLRAPSATDRWTRLLAAVQWQVWLARPLVADDRLPWERPVPPARLSPSRVRRACGGLLPLLGSPARAPKSRGKAPGRPPGQSPGPAARYPVHRRPKPQGPGHRPAYRAHLKSAA